MVDVLVRLNILINAKHATYQKCQRKKNFLSISIIYATYVKMAKLAPVPKRKGLPRKYCYALDRSAMVVSSYLPYIRMHILRRQSVNGFAGN